ncbi:MAG: hypothetical protein IPO27_09080 [Bacteroidetes bacterium]|nr:hypothetical protein [Bacteroidota bacterium]
MKKLILTLSIVGLAFVTQAQQIFVLRTGEKISGKITGMNGEEFTASVNGVERLFKFSELQQIVFEKKENAIEAQVPSGTMTADVAGRKLLKSPKMQILTQDKGIVVVAVTIDKYGKVKSANPGAEGTNTTSEYLLTKAKQAAEGAVFDTSPTAPLETKGTITIVY